MKDTITKGTGNSILIKSVSDFLTQYPTYEDMATALVTGTFPIDLMGLNSDGVEQTGTALNKANLLTDETAAALGLTGSATPNEALAQMNTLMNPLPVSRGGTGASHPARGLYALIGGLTADLTGNQLELNDTVAVADRSDQQAKAMSISNFAIALSYKCGVAKTEIGSYVGTGTYGSGNPNSLTFSIIPKVVFITRHDDYHYISLPYVWTSKYLVPFAMQSSTISAYNIVSTSGYKMTWYYNGTVTPGQAAYQFNESGVTYDYVVFGRNYTSG